MRTIEGVIPNMQNILPYSTVHSRFCIILNVQDVDFSLGADAVLSLRCFVIGCLVKGRFVIGCFVKGRLS